ncbi:MAG TPA: cytochrome P450 [Stellaceae bacterium]|nr:cytochrome P450 [Stellaceae bacterium]
MSDFVPPFPERPREPLPPLALLRAARRNFLAIWHEKSFEYQFFSTRVLARTLFVCNSPDTVAAAFISHHDSFERKTPQMRHALAPLLGDGLFISDGETWRRRRRIVAPIVHASRLPLFAPVMIEAAAETAERWARLPPGTTIDVLREMATLTAEIICRTVFGRRLGAEHAHLIAASFSTYQRLVGQLDLPSLLGLPDWLPRLRAPAIGRAAARIHRVLDGIIASCRERAANGDSSMISLLLEARDEETGEALDARALRSEAAVIFMAGHETTANSLAWTWYLLSQAPEVEARLHRELDAVLGTRLPRLEDVPLLVYTRAVFEETIRLYPPVPLLGREAVRGETIRNRPVPQGSLVIVVPWLLHRHRKFWDCPDRFVPERFLPDRSGQRPRHVYIPFSTGPRICAGAAFGLTEAVLCLATLAQRVRLSLAPGATVAPVCRLTLRPGEGLPMRIDRRE